MYKSQLQELVQKSSWPAPHYEFVKEGASHLPRFKATVEVNGVTYESAPGFSNLKSAEHAAAKTALCAIMGSGTSAVVQQPVHQSGLIKNMLQEYAQKSGFPLPAYRSVRTGEDHAPTFTTTVEIGGMHYSGGPARNKKEAEIKAARTALIAIQSLDIAPTMPIEMANRRNHAQGKVHETPQGKKRPRPRDASTSEPPNHGRQRTEFTGVRASPLYRVPQEHQESHQQAPQRSNDEVQRALLSV